MPGEVREGIGLAVDLGEGLHHGALVGLTFLGLLEAVITHVHFESVARMSGAGVHGAHHRHVGHQLLARFGEVAVADVAFLIDAIAFIAPFQDTVALGADILEAIHDMVGRHHRIEHVIARPTAFQIPVDEKLGIGVGRDGSRRETVGPARSGHSVSPEVGQEIGAGQPCRAARQALQESAPT